MFPYSHFIKLISKNIDKLVDFFYYKWINMVSVLYFFN
jgi:hypothetical protein